jgi:hypothetical protein
MVPIGPNAQNDAPVGALVLIQGLPGIPDNVHEDLQHLVLLHLHRRHFGVIPYDLDLLLRQCPGIQA